MTQEELARLLRGEVDTAVYQLLLEAEEFFKDREDYQDALDDLEAMSPYLTKVDDASPST